MEIVSEEITNAELLIRQYKDGIEFQWRRLIDLNHELGRLDERIGDSGDHA